MRQVYFATQGVDGAITPQNTILRNGETLVLRQKGPTEDVVLPIGRALTASAFSHDPGFRGYSKFINGSSWREIGLRVLDRARAEAEAYDVKEYEEGWRQAQTKREAAGRAYATVLPIEDVVQSASKDGVGDIGEQEVAATMSVRSILGSALMHYGHQLRSYRAGLEQALLEHRVENGSIVAPEPALVEFDVSADVAVSAS
jgi:hypothetical protein